GVESGCLERVDRLVHDALQAVDLRLTRGDGGIVVDDVSRVSTGYFETDDVVTRQFVTACQATAMCREEDSAMTIRYVVVMICLCACSMPSWGASDPFPAGRAPSGSRMLSLGEHKEGKNRWVESVTSCGNTSCRYVGGNLKPDECCPYCDKAHVALV